MVWSMVLLNVHSWFNRCREFCPFRTVSLFLLPETSFPIYGNINVKSSSDFSIANERSSASQVLFSK